MTDLTFLVLSSPVILGLPVTTNSVRSLRLDNRFHLLTTPGIVNVMLFWGTLEANVGMVACCLPTLRPLFSSISIESIVNSARSVRSLRSWSSGGHRSNRSQTESQTELRLSISSGGGNHVPANNPAFRQGNGDSQISEKQVHVWSA